MKISLIQNLEAMGGARYYREDGGFSQYLYRQVGQTFYYGGLKCKIIEKTTGQNSHDGLPLYSNTSDVYLRIDPDSGKVGQARVYKDRKAALDFDWDREHKNFPKGVVHVHEYEEVDGKLRRKPGEPRLMTDEEIEKYGPILKQADPDVKFR